MANNDLYTQNIIKSAVACLPYIYGWPLQIHTVILNRSYNYSTMHCKAQHL